MDATNADYAELIKILKSDGILIVPTDTLYGICCLANSRKALERIYSVKGRQEMKPLGICVSSVEKISSYASYDPDFERLFRNLLPGCYTFVLKRKISLPKVLNPSESTIGVRVPQNDFILGLSRMVETECGTCLALTSANLSGEASCISLSELGLGFRQKVDLVVDGGEITQNSKDRSGSTVVDLTKRPPKIIRKGSGFEKLLLEINHIC